MTNSAQSSNSLSQSTLTTSSDLSKRINSIRFLLIVLVVFIHSNPLTLDSTYNVADIPTVTKFVITSIAEPIARLAVPLLFLISGYLLYTKETKFLPVLKKKSRTLLLPHLIWCSLAALMYFVGQSFDFSEPYFTKYIIRNFEFTDWLSAFAGLPQQPTKYHAMYFSPMAYPFWFVRDLFVLNLLFLPIKKIIDKFPFCTIFIMFILWISCINIHIVSTEALLFFSLGYYVVKYSLDYKKIDKIKAIDIAILYAITITMWVFFIDKVPIIHNINIIIGGIACWKLSGYLVRRPKLYSNLAKLNAYTFFVYAFHAVLVPSTTKMCVKVLPTNDYWLVLHFFVGAILGVMISLSTAIFMKKYFSKIYSISTGGRM